MIKSLIDHFEPLYEESINFKNWIAVLDERTCIICRKNHGRIYYMSEIVQLAPPIHERCSCEIQVMKAVVAGNATDKGMSGADCYIKKYGKLPDDYISVSEAKELGWKPFLGNLDKVAPNKQLSNGVFSNRERKLPDKNGRIWYEADINYHSGYRNSMRIVFSNDGLIFVTYDHYQTFYEIV